MPDLNFLQQIIYWILLPFAPILKVILAWMAALLSGELDVLGL